MTEQNRIRNLVQEQALDAWFDHSCSGYAVISMGVGKSKIIADAINRFMDSYGPELPSDLDIPILVLVNSTFLRDEELPKELKKWNCNHKVKIACYQTAYKWKDKNIGLLLADELDFAVSESSKYLKVLKHNQFKYWFGMTGSMIEKKAELFQETLPGGPFFTYSLQQAQSDGVLNKTKIILHEVPLTTEIYQNTPYGEIKKYIWIQGKIDKYKNLIYEAYDIINNANSYPYDVVMDAEEALKKAKGLKQYWESNAGNKNSRKVMMYSLKSTIDYARNLKEYLLTRDETSKVITFSEFTKDADAISNYTYHGKSPNNKIITQFNEGEIRELGVCKKVNRGVNFNGLNHAIIQSFSSSVTNALQGYIGRLVRLNPDQTAYLHFLFSSYPHNGDIKYCRNLQWVQDILSAPETAHLNEEYFKLESVN